MKTLTWITKLFILTVILTTSPILGFQRGNELGSIPNAKMEQAGFLEVGGGGTFGYRNSGSRANSEADIFLRLALSDHFEYGITDLNNTMYHHFQLGFEPIGTKTKQAHLAIGIKNIGWMANAVSTKSTSTVIGGYIVSSFQLSDNGAWIHAGFAESKQKARVVGFCGIEFETSVGRLSAEWDGEYYTFGYRQKFSDTVALTLAALTRFHPTDYPDQTAESIRIGLSFFDNPKAHPAPPPTSSVKSATPTANPLLKPSMATLNMTATGNVSGNATPKDKKKTKKPDDTMKKSLSLIQKGNYFYYQGMFQEALEEYLEFIRLNPKLATGYINAGSIYMQLGLPEKAKENWRKALEIEPDNVTLISYLKKNNMTDLLPDTIDDTETPDMAPPTNDPLITPK